MATTYSVFTRILGEDFASEVFRKVGASAKNAFAPVAAFNKAIDKPNANALGKVGSAFDSVASKARGGLNSLSAWLPALGAIGSAASLGGLIAMTRRVAEGFEGLELGAQKLGVSTKDLANWRYSAKLVNVDGEQLEKGLVKLKKAMFDAATGKNKDAAALFAAMKIPLRDANGGLRGLEAVLPEVLESFKNTHDETTKNAMALLLFSRAGAELLPWLDKGREGLAKDAAEKAKHSKLTDDQRKGLSRLAGAYKQLDAAGSGLASRLGASVAPALTGIVGWTTAWIDANRELIGQSLDRKVEKIGRAFEFLRDAGDQALHVPWVAELFKGADASTAFDVGLGALGVTMAGPLLSAIQWVTVAWGKMTIAMVTNPVVAGLALLTVQIWSLSNHWKEKMEVIRAASEEGFGAKALAIFKEFNGLTLIAESANDLVKTLTGIDLGKLVRAILKGMILSFKQLGPDIEALWKSLVPDWAQAWASKNTVPLTPLLAAGQPQANAYRDAYSSGVNAAGMPMPPTPASPMALAGPGAAPVQKSEVTVKMDFTNVPQGVKPEITSSGVAKIQSNVGWSMDDGRY